MVDESGHDVPAGTIGRLAVPGPTGCRYLSDPRQADYVKGGWNHTGDAYLQDADGYYFYQSRTDDMIISVGYNIAPPRWKTCCCGTRRWRSARSSASPTKSADRS